MRNYDVCLAETLKAATVVQHAKKWEVFWIYLKIFRELLGQKMTLQSSSVDVMNAWTSLSVTFGNGATHFGKITQRTKAPIETYLIWELKRKKSRSKVNPELVTLVWEANTSSKLTSWLHRECEISRVKTITSVLPEFKMRKLQVSQTFMSQRQPCYFCNWLVSSGFSDK